MTDETDLETQQETSADPFEVKWRKKNERPSPAPEPAVTTETPDTAALQQELDDAQGRIKDLQERWHRAQADLANLRRRTEQERGDMEKFASMMLVAELLPVLDNFDRAVSTIPGNLAMLTWIQGVILIQRHLQAILEHQGVQPIQAAGQQFNPQLHEAINEVETSDHPAGTVVQEYQTGYTMHGRVIRPTLVEVARAPQTVEETNDEPQPETTEEGQAERIADEAETENVGP
jgi:molecular chaperone GrpE